MSLFFVISNDVFMHLYATENECRHRNVRLHDIPLYLCNVYGIFMFDINLFCHILFHTYCMYVKALAELGSYHLCVFGNFS